MGSYRAGRGEAGARGGDGGPRGDIPRRLKQSTLARFLLVGGVSYLVNQALLYLLYEHLFRERALTAPGTPSQLDGGLLTASLLAMEASILVRFLLNDRWTFRDRGGSRFGSRLVQSNVSSLGSPLIALACVNLLTPLLGISYLAANSIGIAVGLAWNWVWSTRVVWRQALAAETLAAGVATREAR